MRIYETKADQQNEESVARALGVAWASSQSRSIALGNTDRFFYRGGKLKACVEIKCRKNASNKYRDYMVDADKLKKGLARARCACAKLILAVWFTDGIFWTIIDEDTIDPKNIRTGGRTDRGDKNDIEPCCYIPMEKFVQIPDKFTKHLIRL